MQVGRVASDTRAWKLRERAPVRRAPLSGPSLFRPRRTQLRRPSRSASVPPQSRVSVGALISGARDVARLGARQCLAMSFRFLRPQRRLPAAFAGQVGSSGPLWGPRPAVSVQTEGASTDADQSPGQCARVGDRAVTGSRRRPVTARSPTRAADPATHPHRWMRPPSDGTSPAVDPAPDLAPDLAGEGSRETSLRPKQAKRHREALTRPPAALRLWRGG